MDILIKEARLWGQDSAVDIAIENGTVEEVASHITGTADSIIEASGRLALPAFFDMHVHLDNCFLMGKHNISGSLWESIQIRNELQKNRSYEDIMKRARKAAQWMVVQGTTTARVQSAVTTGDPEMKSVEAMLNLRAEMKDILDIRITAFPQDGVLTQRENLSLLEEAAKMGVDNIGLIPHNEYTREDGVESVHEVFKLAKKYNKDIDAHIDETDDEQSRFLEVLAADTIRFDMSGRVAAGHATAMHSYNGAYTYKLFGLLKKAGVVVVSNPLINVTLQGRFDAYPKRRGLTRIKELLDYGINVSLGSDDLMNPFYPFGRGDMLQSLFMVVHLAQLTSRDDLMGSLDMITSNPARALCFERYGIAPGNAADLIIMDSDSEVDTIRDQPPRLFVIRNGVIIARSAARMSTLIRDGREEEVSFGRGQLI